MKKLLLLIKNYLVYNIVWLGKLNLFFTKIKSWLYLNLSLFSQRDVSYLIDQFHYFLLIKYIKMPEILKHQQFQDNGSDEIEPRGWKCHLLNEHDNKEVNSLDEDKCEIKGGSNVFLPFIPLLLPQKVSNRTLDLGKGVRSLNHLIYIPKICYSRSVNFALEFTGREGSKTQQKIYTSRVREGLESHSAFTASTASETTNYHCLIRERLKFYPFSN